MSSDRPDQNPFAAPQIDEQYAPPEIADLTEAERIRREYLTHETSIRSIGLLCYLGVLLSASIAIGLARFPIFLSDNAESPVVLRWSMAIGVAIAVVLAGVHGWVGFGLRSLMPAVRPWAIVLSVLWLIYHVVFINIVMAPVTIYILWVLMSHKGATVLSKNYQEIREATPHIRYQTPTYMWVILAVVLLLLAVIIGFNVLGGWMLGELEIHDPYISVRLK